MMKEGEVKILRNGAEKTAKEHQKQIESEHSMTSSLQDKIAAMERVAMEEKQRYRSEILFARQEHESAIRHQRAASQYPTTIKKSANAQRTSPRAKPASKKGFQNSFFESSPSDSKRRGSKSTPAPLLKGKEKATELDIEFWQDDLPKSEEEFEEPVTHSARDGFISFIFSHHPIPPSHLASSIHAIVNFNPPLNADENIKISHRQACQQLFDCLGHTISSKLDIDIDIEQQDRIFLSNLILATLQFVSVFNHNSLLEELIITLVMLRDLLFQFNRHLFHQPTLLDEQTVAIKSTFVSILSVIRVGHAKAVEISETEQINKNKATTSSRFPPIQKGRILRNDSRIKMELQLEPILLAAIDILQILAWHPDDGTIAK